MKRKELVLDFTSLLDVIMILLFVVIGNINQVSKVVSEEKEIALAEAEAQIEVVSAEAVEWKEKYDKLLDEYDYLKITSNYDVNDTTVYEAAVERITKIVLICETNENSKKECPEVMIDIHINTNQSSQETFVGSFVIIHDLFASKAEREVLSAKQITELTKRFADVLSDDTNPMLWFSIQYVYNDENITYSDLEIIKKAIENLELSFSKSCFIEEFKIY